LASLEGEHRLKIEGHIAEVEDAISDDQGPEENRGERKKNPDSEGVSGNHRSIRA
jgi:hypothetical protein